VCVYVPACVCVCGCMCVYVCMTVYVSVCVYVCVKKSLVTHCAVLYRHYHSVSPPHTNSSYASFTAASCRLSRKFEQDKYVREQEAVGGADASDYSTVCARVCD